MNDRETFRERLLKLESVTPALRDKYLEEISAMYEKPIAGWQRWTWLAAAVWAVVSAIAFAALAVTLPADFPFLGRLGFAAGTLFAAGWAILAVRVFRRGALNMKVDNATALMMGYALMLVIAILLLVMAPNTISGLRMMLNGIFFLIVGATFLFRYIADQSNLQTREKLLEIEYQLAELSQRVTAVKEP